MKSFVLTPRAELDLIEIWEYLAQDNLETADRILHELEATMCKLARMPGMGHVREDLVDPRHRCWPVYSYLIVYRPETEPLQVVRVVSGYRDLARLLG